MSVFPGPASERPVSPPPATGPEEHDFPDQNVVLLHGQMPGAKKDEIMFEIVKCKFEQYPDLADKLIKITEPIVEHNDWNDTYWGVCNGNGQNKLGQILAEIREILIVEKAINDVLSSSNYPTLPEYINSFMWDLKVYFMKFFPNNLPHFIDYEMNDCKLFLKVQPHSSVQHLKIPLGGVCCD